MKPRILLLALVAALLPVLAACGSSGEDESGDDAAGKAGADACTIYRTALEEDSMAIADAVALADIKETLADLDAPTRRAFANLITAADSNPYVTGAGRNAVPDAAAAVRSVCLAEHDIEIPN